MSERKQITVERRTDSLRNCSSIEVDALNAVGSIPGVSDLQIEAASQTSVVCSYTWLGETPFDRTDEHLAGFGLRKVWASPNEA